MDLMEVSDKLESLISSEDVKIKIAQSMDYPTLVGISKTSEGNRLLVEHLLPSKFAEYVRSNMKYISAGRLHTAFINDQGQLYVMGHNFQGQLGLGHIPDVTIPTLVKGFKVMAVSTGRSHTVFITDRGQLYAMGDNYYGQLGLGSISNAFTPTLVEGFKVVAVSAGDQHTAFITDQGKLYVMGHNMFGQLGVGHTNNVKNPTLIKTPAGVEHLKVIAVSAGGHHTAFITEGGQLYDTSFQLGVTIPTQIMGFRVVAVSAGGHHTAFITDQGQLYVIGSNLYGQFGFFGLADGKSPILVEGYSHSSTDETIPAPIEPKVVAVSASDSTAFITDQGQLYVMGSNNYGQLGFEHKKNIYTPTLIEDHTRIPLQHLRVIAVSSGYSHTIFVTDEGQLYVMGLNDCGQLGLGHKKDVFTPTLMPIM